MNVHQLARRQPIQLATATIDVGGDALAEAEISEVLSRPLVSTELAAALARHYTSSRSEPFSISRLRHLLGFLLRFFVLLALARPCAAFTRYVRNTITDG